MVTKKDIKNLSGINLENIEQIGSKQLFVVTYPKYELIYSYTTIIGFKKLNQNAYIMTDRKYSKTTTTHKNRFKHTTVNDLDFRLQLQELRK